MTELVEKLKLFSDDPPTFANDDTHWTAEEMKMLRVVLSTMCMLMGNAADEIERLQAALAKAEGKT